MVCCKNNFMFLFKIIGKGVTLVGSIVSIVLPVVMCFYQFRRIRYEVRFIHRRFIPAKLNYKSVV